ncbi:allantoinase AllB [Jiangella endophytica]|uniref:allantoinase AllB n=1 Tax=Jiangella endophytica TaxID=1623398 RepID=UPI000E3440F0|nr:allantoinase AllB [Jiangella endophytica]
MTATLVVRARRALVGDELRPATVVVRDGVVAAVAPLDARLAPDVELAPDEVLLPGLVDTHVHVDEPGRTEWEGFETATAAALAAGVTTLVDMPLNSLPPTLTADALAAKRRAAAGRCRVDVGFWGGVTPDSLGALPDLLDAGVPGVKCFLSDSGVPEFPPLSLADLERAAAIVASRSGLLLVHAEDPDLLASAPAPRGPGYAAFVASRPAAAEATAIENVVAAAGRTGCRVHVVHVSSAAGAGVVRAAKAAGVAVTAETCPHYLFFAAEKIPDGAPLFKCCPPIRGRADQDALWAALLDGTLDAVVSDHSPAPPELKELVTGDLGRAWGGIASLQFAFAATLTAAAERGVPTARVVRWMASAPADLAGLRAKGRIAPGADADLVVLAPDETFVVRPDLVRHRHPLTPYEGRRLRGVVRRVWLRGAEPGSEVSTGRLLGATDQR